MPAGVGDVAGRSFVYDYARYIQQDDRCHRLIAGTLRSLGYAPLRR